MNAHSAVLMGPRHPRESRDDLLRGVHGMEDSVTYQAIVEKGEIRGLQRTLLQLGRKRFGQPDDATSLSIRSIQSVERLDKLAERILEANSWSDLFSE